MTPAQPNLQPLAALLALHPEECAAVVAVLCAEGWNGCHEDEVAYHAKDKLGLDITREVTAEILKACKRCGVAELSMPTGWRIMPGPYRYAIAHMSAAAWLHARLSLGPTPLERMSAAFDHLAAINVVADGLPPMERDAVEQARLRLFVALDGTAHAKRGIPEYGEDEVRERTGAQAPKGEKR